MSTFDDDLDVQARRDERLLTGRSTDEDPALVDLVTALRASATPAGGPVPRPNAALRAVLRDGLVPGADGVAMRGPTPAATPDAAPAARLSAMRRRVVRFVLGLGLAGKIALGAGVAMAAVGGAAAVDAVPDSVQRPASDVVTGVLGVLGVDPGAVGVPSTGVPSPTGSPSTSPAGSATSPSPSPTPAAGPPAATGAPGRSGEAPGRSDATTPAGSEGAAVGGQGDPGSASPGSSGGRAVPAEPATPAEPGANGHAATPAPGQGSGAGDGGAAPAVPAQPADRSTSAGRSTGSADD